MIARHVDATGADAQIRGSAVLPSASMSCVLARADAYDAIRVDEKFAAWVARVGGVDGVCLRGSWLHGLNHAGSDCDLLVVGASVDDKVRAVNVHAGGVDALCVTVGRFARLLAQADQVCVEARAYNGVLWRDGAALASGRGDVGRLVKLARNVVRQEACADSLAERGVLPVVSWGRVVEGVRSLAAGGVVGDDVLAGVERLAGLSR